MELARAAMKGAASVYSAASTTVKRTFTSESYPYKMLLIGETGSGKTSFLNLLCNCGLMQSLGFDEGFQRLRQFNDINLENSESHQMESKTNDAKLYNVELGELKVSVIDTPGFADSRGLDQDKKNVQKIIDALKAEEYINCVCLVVNGRQTRMSATLGYVLTEITSILPREALNNVIVVFTNTADELDLHFDAEIFKEYFGRVIEHKYMIENPYCRFEKAKMMERSDKIDKKLKRSFEDTSEELTEMCSKIKTFNRVHTNDFIALYDTKQAIEQKVLTMLTEYDNQKRLETHLKKAQQDINAALETKKLYANYTAIQEFTRWVLVKEPKKRHNTLCGADNCHYNCHLSCRLEKSYDKEEFKNCYCMRGGTKCTECGHHYTLHYHTEAKFVEKVERQDLVDERMKEQFEQAQTMEERKRIFQDELQLKLRQSEEERRRLSKQLLLTMEEFHKLGANRNYAKLLENQLAVIEQRIEGSVGDESKDLRKTKEGIEIKLQLVQAALESVTSTFVEHKSTSYPHKMLLIGETGSGKTSFLNLLCNCGLMQSLGSDEGFQQLRKFNDINLENSESRQMESKTNDAKLYNVELGELKVSVIDTPGFADSRGLKQDKKNVRKIIDALKAEEYINCVCLVVNGRQTRMSATLGYVLTEITSILPREALNNVIVVFTNTADVLELNFDAEIFKHYFGRIIEHQYMIENPYCRFEKAKAKKGKIADDKIAKSLKKSFEETSEELTEMCSKMMTFNRVHTNRFVTLYEKKQAIERKVVTMLTEYNNQKRLEGHLKKAQLEMTSALATKKLYADYTAIQEINRWVVVKEPEKRHNTLCGAAGCYSNCHLPCYLEKSFSKEVIKNCHCMRGGTTCTICGHHYTLHYYTEGKFEKKVERNDLVDPKMKEQFEQAQTMEERMRIFQYELQKQLRRSEEERRRLSKQLLLTMEEFHKLGANRNYAKLLENQLAVIEHCIEGTVGDDSQDLRKTKEEIEIKLQLVQAALESVTSTYSAASAFVEHKSTSYPHKMLLIGETGSGKTSILNLLCNCGLMQSLGSDEEFQRLRQFNDINLENSESRQMESKTNDAKLYNVELGELKVSVIDTPGFADSRGLDQDKKNVRKIIDALKAEDYINCVCLVVNGRQARMSATLGYVLTEITSILPREALNNVIVVFTNTADVLELNFDAEIFKKYFGRVIEHQYMIENPYCRFEKAKAKKGKIADDKIAKSLKKSFEETSEELTEMCSKMMTFNGVHTNRFVTLYEKKQAIERKVVTMLTEYNNQKRLEGHLKKAQLEITSALATKMLFANHTASKVIERWIFVEEPEKRHNLLCGDVGCYSNCQLPCYLEKSFDKDRLRNSRCMDGGTTCTKCGHHYTLHYHYEGKFEKKVEREDLVDERMKEQFEQAQTMEERKRIFQDELQLKLRQSEEERRRLSKQLLLTMEEFHKLGANRNYAKLLENQLAVIEQRIEGSVGDESKDLRKTKEGIEIKLQLVQSTLKEPLIARAGQDHDPKEWACSLLGLDPMIQHSDDEVKSAFQKVSKTTHPDIGGESDTEYFKRVGRAKDILLSHH